MVSRWEFEPLVVIPLALAAVFYAAGLARLWRKAGVGQGVSTWAAVSFAAGWLTLVVALMSPVAWLAEILFSVHMAQHTLLLLIAAPLLTFGQPLLVWLWALPLSRRDRAVRPLRGRALTAFWRRLTAPLTAFLIQAVALWVWHIPSWYQAALHNDAVHALEHFSFVLAGSLFWWAMVHGRYGRAGYGLSVLYVFMTAVHSSGLGALLTVSDSVWYRDYIGRGAVWHIDALADQQVAGLLMWIPAGVIFIVLGLALMAAWLGEADRRAAFATAQSAPATRTLLLAFVLLAATTCGACSEREARDQAASAITGGDVRRGQTLLGNYGCGSCHSIPGVVGATATVGPPLDRIAVRQYLGGHLVNTPDNMILWIQRPQQVDPKNAMPNLGVPDQDARDLAAFLYTLR